MLANSVAVMQPYFFPNLAYYKLVRHVEHFIFFNDVHFIKGGWINKNNILYNQQALLFRLPLKSASQNKLISNMELFDKEKESVLLLKKIYHSYSKAPFYNEVEALVKTVLDTSSEFIADVAEQSVRAVFSYLELPLVATCSSALPFDRSATDNADRIIALVQYLNKSTYLNAIGGKELYNKNYFKTKGLDLKFVSPSIQPYQQFSHPFVPGLSIIDVLMFNSPSQVVALLDAIEYE
jgi:hypothetical protein